MISIRLNELLKEKNMSVYELQKRTGVSYPTLYNIAREDKPQASIKFDILEKILDVLEVEIKDVLVRE